MTEGASLDLRGDETLFHEARKSRTKGPRTRPRVARRHRLAHDRRRRARETEAPRPRGAPPDHERRSRAPGLLQFRDPIAERDGLSCRNSRRCIAAVFLHVHGFPHQRARHLQAHRGHPPAACPPSPGGIQSCRTGLLIARGHRCGPDRGSPARRPQPREAAAQSARTLRRGWSAVGRVGSGRTGRGDSRLAQPVRADFAGCSALARGALPRARPHSQPARIRSGRCQWQPSGTRHAQCALPLPARRNAAPRLQRARASRRRDGTRKNHPGDRRVRITP